MVEIMTAESVARETIKNVLETEIPKVNDAIQTAKKKGSKSCYIKNGISVATVKLLEKAGYCVETEYDSADISWEGIYNTLMNSDEFLEDISKELNVRIVDADNADNTINPNWSLPPIDE